MNGFFTAYEDAAIEARKDATHYRMDVAIRSVCWYGRNGYVVGFASHNDSDYDRGEIVRPGTPDAARTIE